MQKNETVPPSYTIHKKKDPKWIKNLNMRPTTIKLPEENIGSNSFDIDLSNIFLDMSPHTRETKAKIDNWDYTKVKSFQSEGNH